MKKFVLPILILLSLSLLCADLINAEGSMISKLISSMTGGTMNFSVRTATYNGAYAPRNAGVIWITDAQGQFVKTIKVWANQYRYTLIRWINNSGQNTQGAITGASLNNHQLHNITWNGNNYQGTEAPDGTYTVNIEFTEHNAHAGNMGKFKQVSFTKGPEAVNLTIPNETYFLDMTLGWTPVIENGTLSGTVTGENSQPLSDAVVMAGSYSVITGGNGAYSLSLPPGVYSVSCLVGGYQQQTMDAITINPGQTTQLDFALMAVGMEDELNPGTALALSSAYPNPFSASTTLSFTSKIPGKVSAKVFDLKGQRVKTLDILSPTSLIWDGRDDHQRYCPSGIYFIKVNSGNKQATRKVILQR